MAWQVCPQYQRNHLLRGTTNYMLWNIQSHQKSQATLLKCKENSITANDMRWGEEETYDFDYPFHQTAMPLFYNECIRLFIHCWAVDEKYNGLLCKQYCLRTYLRGYIYIYIILFVWHWKAISIFGHQLMEH